MSDLISRQDAIDAMCDYVCSRTKDSTKCNLEYCGVKKRLNALPSAQRKGKWIQSDVPESTLCKCDQCGWDMGAYCYNYCPNCGAEMEEPDD